MTYLVRASAFVVLYAVTLGVSYLGADELGLGLLLFAAFALLAAGWAGLDGRQMAFGRLAFTWALVGLTLGVVVPIGTALSPPRYFFAQSDSGVDTDVLVADLVSSIPFLVALVVPALVAGAMGRATRND